MAAWPKPVGGSVAGGLNFFTCPICWNRRGWDRPVPTGEAPVTVDLTHGYGWRQALTFLNNFVCPVNLWINSASFVVGPFFQKLLRPSNRSLVLFHDRGHPYDHLGTPLQTSGQFLGPSFPPLTLYSWTGPPHCSLGWPCVQFQTTIINRISNKANLYYVVVH